MAPYCLAVLAATLFSLAWWIPSTPLCAVLGWLSAVVLVAFVRRYPTYRAAYLGGVALYALGFYWLLTTIKDFGGFPPAPAAAVFGLFVGVSALQFIAFLFLYKNLPPSLDRFSLRIAVAWTVAEFAIFKIFPWAWGHTQLAFTPFAQIADLAGVPLVTFVLFWCAEALYRAVFERLRGLGLAAPLLSLTLLLGYGELRARVFATPTGIPQPVALIQANLTIREKGNIKFFEANLRRYIDLTDQVVRPGLLVIWPESIFNEFIAATIGSVKGDPRIPFWNNGVSLLIGALTFTSRTEYHNSALAIMPDGTIPPPYHKQILMPFGEYTPLAGLFPWIKELNATAGEFTAGRDITVFRFPAANGNADFGVAPLICYEDIVPGLSRAATRQGATLLVNMTNDAWFGDTAAPHQHHLIAAWRAIENRRFLIRSTNSGLTAIVDPLGKTVVELPTFAEGILEAAVVPLYGLTPYTRFVGDYPWWLLTIATLLATLKNLRRRPGGAA